MSSAVCRMVAMTSSNDTRASSGWRRSASSDAVMALTAPSWFDAIRSGGADFKRVLTVVSACVAASTAASTGAAGRAGGLSEIHSEGLADGGVGLLKEQPYHVLRLDELPHDRVGLHARLRPPHIAARRNSCSRV